MQEIPLNVMLPTQAAVTAIPQLAIDVWNKFRLTDIKAFQGDNGVLVKFEFDLVDPAQADDGSMIEPGKLGSKQGVLVPLYAKADAKDPEWFNKKISRILDALLGTGDPDNKKGKPARPNFSAELKPSLVGQVLLGKHGKNKGADGIERAELQDFAFPADKEAKAA